MDRPEEIGGLGEVLRREREEELVAGEAGCAQLLDLPLYQSPLPMA